MKKHRTILTKRIRPSSSPHSWEIVRGEKYLKQPIKRLTADKRLQTSGIETQRTKHIGEGGQDLSGSWNLQY